MLSLDNPLSWSPALVEAIERQPLVISPMASLMDVLTLTNQSHHRECWLDSSFHEPNLANLEQCTSCVLVMEDGQLCGILTERDLVKYTAQGLDFAAVSVAEVMVSPVITLPEDSLNDIFASLFLFRRYSIRHLPIVNDRGEVIGLISHERIRQILRPANLLKFRRVADVMTKQVISAPPQTSILQLAQMMAAFRVSCIVIVQEDLDGDEMPLGIVTERDIVQFQTLEINLEQTPASRVMSAPLFCLSPEDSLWKAHKEMQRLRVGRLVVSWNWGKNLGLITQTSLLRIFDPIEMYGVIENLQQTIQELRRAAEWPEQDSASESLDGFLEVRGQRRGTGEQKALFTDSWESNRQGLMDLLEMTLTQTQQAISALDLNDDDPQYLLKEIRSNLSLIAHKVRLLNPS
ncbi:MAG: CBS domain-containing protein [Synechocystis sp.]|nr:CBS domain-containing protein [Synechocystis sp.]